MWRTSWLRGPRALCARLYLGGLLQIRIRFVKAPTPTLETNKQSFLCCTKMRLKSGGCHVYQMVEIWYNDFTYLCVFTLWQSFWNLPLIFLNILQVPLESQGSMELMVKMPRWLPLQNLVVTTLLFILKVVKLLNVPKTLMICGMVTLYWWVSPTTFV